MAIRKELKKITKGFAKNYNWELVETPVYKDKVMQTRFFDSPEKAVEILMETYPAGIYLMNHYNVAPMRAVDFFADPPNLRIVFALRFAPKDKS